jgi:hypothetical protein
VVSGTAFRPRGLVAAMNRPALLAAVVAFAVLAAGCSQPKESASPSPSATSSSSASAASTQPPAVPAANASARLPTLGLDGCRNFGGVFPVPVESAQAVLPPGFEPVPTPSDPAGGATLYVLGLRCEGSSVDGVVTGASDLLYAELAVVPAADQRIRGLDDCTVPVLFASGNAAVGEALARLRLGLAGAGEVAWAEHTGAGDVIVAATLGGASVTLRGTVASAEPAASLGDGSFAVYAVQGGAVQAALRGHATSGTVQHAAATLEAAGAPAPIGDARPAASGFTATGFSAAGFSLTFEDAAP